MDEFVNVKMEQLDLYCEEIKYFDLLTFSSNEVFQQYILYTRDIGNQLIGAFDNATNNRAVIPPVKTKEALDYCLIRLPVLLNDINYRLSALKRNGNDYLPAELAPFPQNRPRRFLLCSASFYVELITYIIQNVSHVNAPLNQRVSWAADIKHNLRMHINQMKALRNSF